MITGAQTAAWKAGYVLLVVDTHELEDLADFVARVLLGRRVEGVILGSEHHPAVEVPPALRAHNPALADCFSKSGDYWAIVPDEVGGRRRRDRWLLEREKPRWVTKPLQEGPRHSWAAQGLQGRSSRGGRGLRPGLRVRTTRAQTHTRATSSRGGCSTGNRTYACCFAATTARPWC